MPAGLQDVSRYPALFHELQRRRWSEADLKALAGANILRTLRDAESCAGSVTRLAGSPPVHADHSGASIPGRTLVR